MTKTKEHETMNAEDEKAYKETIGSKWYKAWEAVEAWYPYRRKMHSFHLFVDAFKAKNFPEAIKLCKRFKMTGSVVDRMTEEFNKLHHKEMK